MGDVQQVTFGRRPPTDLAAQLRALADAVDAGEVLDCAAVFVRKGEYDYLWAASLEASVTLATLLQWRALRRMEA